MNKHLGNLTLALVAALAAALATAPRPAHAQFQEPCTIDNPDSCNFPPPGGGGGGTPTGPTYTLQGVIQHQGYEYSSGGFRHAKIRGYSRFANQNNDRVDADYIEVRCYAYGPTGNTMDYDDETNGALVDVHFYSSGYPAIGGSGIVNVQCTHYAENNGVVYNATSSAQIAISNYP
ncbi:hypothetical protein [Tahibacter soli]|uniref:Uncharacterized protein n=1 Tax=Tahibacter soli TaxID=2983605 RepID=A0A9X4BJ02_9GAMM|nr:hypothetical protein [Tahibacter soli]MDC8012747.1 hypothetical protein [Tahibacter soli]